MIIYQITNKSNNKKYIGITSKSLQTRWNQHLRYALRYNSQLRLHRAIRKYGTINFIIEPIDYTQTLDKALQKEKQLIEQLDTYKKGYNSTFGGDHYIDCNWQRENQLRRVKNGTHPFVGGQIQRVSSKRRWENNTNPIKEMNQKRLKEGNHNFQGNNNPCRKLAQQGKHHNQKPAWFNTKANKQNWMMAQHIYNKWLDTNWSYRNLENHFKTTGLQKMVKMLKGGWVPNKDPQWLRFSRDD